MLLSYIEAYYSFGKVIFFLIPFAVLMVFLIKYLFDRPVKKIVILFSFLLVIVWLFFSYSFYVELKVESYISKFSSASLNEYSVKVNGKEIEQEVIITPLKNIWTKFTNKTFSSRKNKRSVEVIKGNETIELTLYDSSERESFIWVVYIVPGTEFKYIGRITNNETK